jgi:glutamate-ammonia-ligase adenylyltransferase
MIAHPSAHNTFNLPKASRAHDIAAITSLLLQPSWQEKAPYAHALLDASAGNSVFLARLIERQPDVFLRAVNNDYAHLIEEIMHPCSAQAIAQLSGPEVMQKLRQAKERMALTLALADITEHMPLLSITRALSEFASAAVSSCVHHLLTQAHKRGEFQPANADNPQIDSGIIILGMGKLGAYELNYSSDIDLIILYDREILPYTGARNAQQFMNKFAQDITQMMQERTADGYVFRTDLRLRPDPSSTPLAVTTSAALTYYETVGQNWERAAMIKARPIAGDIAAGESFLKELRPYVWRKNLDFAAIADIHSIKRQMNAHSNKQITLAGHNIKTGVGGIREIEFFVQTQQLVWGGRLPALRVRGTLDALHALHEAKLIDDKTREIFYVHYHYLRHLEHRLQMREDAQTHTIPEDAASILEVSNFMGCASVEVFERTVLGILREVHHIYSESMQNSEPLSVDGNLVFTGVEADAETLETLTRMGYSEPQRISELIQNWHRGHRRSTRSKRSRQVLTELMPAILTALAKTANPMTAFFQFDDFLDRLPSGAQIFSLMHSRPDLLDLVAEILGSAPALGNTLGANPLLLDSVLEADFFLPLPSLATLNQLISDRLKHTQDSEQAMIFLRVFHNEKRFQAGVHMLKRLATPSQVSAFLTELAEVILCHTLRIVIDAYGKDISHAELAIIGFGKLGARDLTFGSDLDIIFLYHDDGDAASELRTHMHRISQRVISALTLMMREGRLYEVDTRLRPGGSDGPLATSLVAFNDYFTHSAWTFERMALTRARVIASTSEAFSARITQDIAHYITAPHDDATVRTDMLEMRERIAKEYPTENPLHVKHVRGGMIDIDFLAQMLVLVHANQHPNMYQHSTTEVLEYAATHGVITISHANDLIAHYTFFDNLLCYLRLCAPEGIMQPDAPHGLRRLVAEAMGAEDCEVLTRMLHEKQLHVLHLIQSIT